ncbi:glycosyltransferase family 2 protein [Rhizobium sp. P40RR-XXII]|uniref:glycosyltransferase n=1 Tax=unclassified Rhizobium TaxID=2613769 RepID=UPI0014577246|nr:MULTISPECIES: glycosyltransferase family A protein [unclassified Rhizobium]NLR89362.1 glycosyltransferase family 2 protein [Rhizobium sp. P28RR-XV]NLS21216.1 glycosyltransferase family 2 protein [Rhizobium sp. P40RR-XXII]
MKLSHLYTAGSRERTICVGTVTRARPQMLSNLLKSYSRLNVPDGIRLHFIVVENNETASLSQAIEHFRAQVPNSTVQYELETQLGIAFARNRVLETALALGGDMLTFADDDEIVAEDWLEQLLAARDAQDFDIVASPVRFTPPPVDASPWNRMVWSGMNRMNRNSEARSIRLLDRGEAKHIKLATGSWMGKLEFFRRTGLRFDNALGLAGGEDWQLWTDALKLGAYTTWTPHAIAYETVPVERLTLHYHYRRSRDHSSILIERRKSNGSKTGSLQMFASILGRVWTLCYCILAAPLTGGRTLVRAAACLGSIVGLLRGRLGFASPHYRTTNGS